MGRWSEALAAGATAVARAQGRQATAAAAGAHVALLPGLSGSRLAAALGAFAAEAPAHAARVVVADHLPPDLDPRQAAHKWPGMAFEHLSPLDDLLAVATPAAATLHRMRRLRIILARHSAVQCLWAGSEAEEIVRAVMAGDLARHQGPPPPLATPGGPSGDLPANPSAILFRPIAFRD
jgi:hypothetical protein